jgi:hypothetical protein
MYYQKNNTLIVLETNLKIRNTSTYNILTRITSNNRVMKLPLMSDYLIETFNTKYASGNYRKIAGYTEIREKANFSLNGLNEYYNFILSRLDAPYENLLLTAILNIVETQDKIDDFFVQKGFTLVGETNLFNKQSYNIDLHPNWKHSYEIHIGSDDYIINKMLLSLISNSKTVDIFRVIDVDYNAHRPYLVSNEIIADLNQYLSGFSDQEILDELDSFIEFTKFTQNDYELFYEMLTMDQIFGYNYLATPKQTLERLNKFKKNPKKLISTLQKTIITLR